MYLLAPNVTLPEIQLQYMIKASGLKIFRIISQPLDKVLINLLEEGKIRIQVWLERELKKRSDDNIKRSWVHSQDNSTTAPTRLFLDTQYDYGGGSGWGWATLGNNFISSYSTNNGYVPTEFEVTANSLCNRRINVEIPILNIFSNILKHEGLAAEDGDDIEFIRILGRHRTQVQPLRVRLMANYQEKVITGPPSNALILGIHRDCEIPIFAKNIISRFIKVAYK